MKGPSMLIKQIERPCQLLRSFVSPVIFCSNIHIHLHVLRRDLWGQLPSEFTTGRLQALRGVQVPKGAKQLAWAICQIWSCKTGEFLNPIGFKKAPYALFFEWFFLCYRANSLQCIFWLILNFYPQNFTIDYALRLLRRCQRVTVLISISSNPYLFRYLVGSLSHCPFVLETNHDKSISDHHVFQTRSPKSRCNCELNLRPFQRPRYGKAYFQVTDPRGSSLFGIRPKISWTSSWDLKDTKKQQTQKWSPASIREVLKPQKWLKPISGKKQLSGQIKTLFNSVPNFVQIIQFFFGLIISKHRWILPSCFARSLHIFDA